MFLNMFFCYNTGNKLLTFALVIAIPSQQGLRQLVSHKSDYASFH